MSQGVRVFLSWSGVRSHRVAEVFRDWLPSVMQSITPWMSSEDMEKGTRWTMQLAEQLQGADVGIICLTPENLRQPWILFEAGALSKAVGASRICPFLYDLAPSDLPAPLAQFQAVSANARDVWKLIATINQSHDDVHVSEPALNKAFTKWWPDLDRALKTVPNFARPTSMRTDRELLEDILSLSRQTVHELVMPQRRARKAQPATESSSTEKAEPSPPPYSSPAAGSESGEA